MRGDPGTFEAVKPLEAASYLRVRGWHREADLDGRGSVWVLPAADGRDEADVTLPLRHDLADFTLRMTEVVRTLAWVEQRPEADVVHDLLTTGSDLIRVRAPSRDAASGSLPLERAVAFAARSRDMMLAAACAAISKRTTFAARKPTKAIEYLGNARMGQTERGSYVLTILSPMAPSLVPDEQYALGLETAEPYERRVTRTLAEALAALEAASREAAYSGGMEAFARAVHRGVSANLCEAITGLSAVSSGEGLEVSVAWSRTRAADAGVASRIVLGGDTIPLIEEAGRRFRETASHDDFDLQGFVTRLSRGPADTSGEITLEGPIDGELRRVTVELTDRDAYALAVQAHARRARAACEGDLIRQGRGLRLRDPRHFRLLGPDDDGWNGAGGA